MFLTIPRYANDQNAFFADYVEAFKQMLFWTPAFEQLDKTSNILQIPRHRNVHGEGKAKNYRGGHYSGPKLRSKPKVRKPKLRKTRTIKYLRF
jgi:hypothetical protein